MWVPSSLHLVKQNEGVVCVILSLISVAKSDVCWLIVRGLLVPAYPKGGRWLKNKKFPISCSPLEVGKESIYVPSFGRFPPTQSTEITRIPWWISPTTQQQCGIFFLVCWIWSIVRGQYIPKGSKKDNEWRSAPAKSSTAAVPELNALRLKGK